MTEATYPIRVAALYKFTRVEDCAALRDELARSCKAAGVMGTLLIASEGINGTIAGSDSGIGEVLRHIRAIPGCENVEIKESRAASMPFYRMKVRIKREIVTMGEPEIDPVAEVGQYVAPADWNALIGEPGTILIDTRNDYEVAIGSFSGAIDPVTRSFRDFPAWFRDNRERLLAGDKPPRVAMYCTGGIRCEKATAFLRSEGVDEVYHLKGGILAYLETIPQEESRWNGECFVFDERVAVGHALAPGSHELCRACRNPLNVEDRASPLFAPGISCPKCREERTDEQRQRYGERSRQVQLADARGEPHVGAVRPPAKRG